MSSVSYTACKAHASCYIVICAVSGSTIFFSIYSREGHDFHTDVFEYKMCFDSLYNFF